MSRVPSPNPEKSVSAEAPSDASAMMT
jgi:hypothetical protein